MTEPREIEAKFEADVETVGRLLELETFGGFAITRKQPKDQDDLYYDTPGQHLRLRGASLRIRLKGSEVQMTFKGDRLKSAEDPNLVSRLEDEVTLSGLSGGKLSWTEPLQVDPEPSPLLRAREIADGLDLLPTARLQTNRTVLMARHENGVTIELAVDTCVATRLADGRVVDFVEVEAELKRGVSEGLKTAIGDLMRAVPGLRPSTRTKLERALG